MIMDGLFITSGTLGAFALSFVVQWILHERGLRTFERQMGIRDDER